MYSLSLKKETLHNIKQVCTHISFFLVLALKCLINLLGEMVWYDLEYLLLLVVFVSFSKSLILIQTF